MQVNELRIGNLVNHISFGIVPISGINKESLKTTYKENDYWDDIIQHQQISLTEEWLIKFGFIDTDWAGGVYNKDGLFWDSYDKEIGFKKQWLDNKCLYVHQLQNLYFALTQTELKIK